LTYAYYGEKLLPYLKHYYLTRIWQEFANRPTKQQLVEEVATFFAQWMQPEIEISYPDIDEQLDNIAQKVMEHLKIKYPKHPIFSISSEQFSYWRCNNIDEDEWHMKDVKLIIHVFCEVLFKQKYFVQSIHEVFTFENVHLINHVSYNT
jgi:hypothetical protein